MPALSTTVGADIRPMDAAFAQGEIIAKRFGKTLADVNAAENAQMLANSAALKALNAERKAARDEAQRYQEALTRGTKTVADASRAENEALLEKSRILKQLNAEALARRGVSGELMTVTMPGFMTGVSGNLMTVQKPEDYARQEKINEYLKRKAGIMGTMGSGMAPGFAGYLEVERTIQNEVFQESKKAAAKSGDTTAKTWWENFKNNLSGHGSGGMAQLVHVVRATTDSLASGMDPMRVFIQQGPQAMQAFMSMAGNTLALLKSIAVVGGSVAAIIGAPFLWFMRRNSIADHISPSAMLDVKPEYIARSNNLAESYHRIAMSVRETAEAYNSATSAAERARKAMEEQFNVQKQLDAISKERAIQLANGDKSRIAQIEKEYEQLNISRESARLEGERKNKLAERDALQKEIAATMQRIAGITFGSEAKHGQTMSDLKAQYEEDQKLIKSSTQGKNWFGRQWQILRAGIQSGGVFAGVFNSEANKRLTNEQLRAEYEAEQNSLQAALQRSHVYEQLVNAEKKRNDAIQERNRLQSEAEKKSQRFAQLTGEINDADKERNRILSNMRHLADARASKIDQDLNFGGNARADLTANQRIGAYVGPGQTTMIDLTRKIVTNTELTVEAIKNQKLQGNDFNAKY